MLYCKLKNVYRAKLYQRASADVFYKHLIKEAYDAEIAFIEGYATRIVAGSDNVNSKKIAWVHIDLTDNPWSDIAFKSLEEQKECYKKFDKIICVSESVKVKFAEKFNIKDTLKTVYNPLDVKDIQAKSREDIGELKSLGLRMITVGRLVRQKGFDRLLNVCKKLKDNHMEFELWILGEGEERAALEQQIKDNQLQGTVTLWGFRKNPYPYFKKSDVFVCSSRAEGFSLVAAEAMMLGLSVVSTNCSGPNELLGYGKYGMLVENTEEGIYKGLSDIILNKQLRE